MPKADSVYLQEILDSLHEIEVFIAGYSEVAFLEDQKTIKAVALCIQFLGEASNHLSSPLKESQPHIPWRKIIGLRHKIVHQYMDIDPEILWDITQKDLPILKQQLLPILHDLQAQANKS